MLLSACCVVDPEPAHTSDLTSIHWTSEHCLSEHSGGAWSLRLLFARCMVMNRTQAKICKIRRASRCKQENMKGHHRAGCFVQKKQLHSTLCMQLLQVQLNVGSTVATDSLSDHPHSGPSNMFLFNLSRDYPSTGTPHKKQETHAQTQICL